MTPRPFRILILTGSFGQGHHTAARNLSQAFEAVLGSEGQVEVVDFFKDAFPRTNRLLSAGYAFAINRAPGLWGGLYTLAERGGEDLLPFRGVHRRFQALLDEKRPTALVATFPGYPLLFEWLYPDRQTRPYPLFTVVTDAISINPVWCRGHSDRLFVADEASQAVVTETLGFPAERVRAFGFPLAPAETHVEPLAPLPGAHPKILFLPTTKKAHVQRSLEGVLRWCARHAGELTLVLGHHEPRLRPMAEKLCREALPEGRFQIHGWRRDVPTLMRQHHLTITKAGGATISETLGAQCPVLINYVVPGQEEGNVELVQRCQCGRKVLPPDDLEKALDEILIEKEAVVWRGYRERLRELDRAAASRRIVDEVLALVRT